MDTQERMIKSACLSRGRVVHLVTFTEAMIDYYIAKQFVSGNDNIGRLKVLLLGEINLGKKSQLFMYFVEKNKAVPEKRLGKLTKDIEGVLNERNLFAHFPLLMSKDAKDTFLKERVLTYQNLRRAKYNGKSEIGIIYGYNEDAVNSLIDRIVKLNNELSEITGIHKDTEPPLEKNPTG